MDESKPLIGGGGGAFAAALAANAAEEGIAIDSTVSEPDTPQKVATTPVVDVDVATAAALTAELEVMQQREVKMEAALSAVISTLPQSLADPEGWKQVVEKSWGNGLEEGIKGHAALIEVATEAIAVLDSTVKVQAQGTEALLVLQEKYLATKKGLTAQLGKLSSALGVDTAGGTKCDQILTCLCPKRDNGEIRVEFNVSATEDSFQYFDRPPAPPSPPPSPPPPHPPPCSRETVMMYGGCNGGDGTAPSASASAATRAPATDPIEAPARRKILASSEEGEVRRCTLKS